MPHKEEIEYMGSFILLEIVTLGLSIIIEFKGSIDAIISLAEDGYIVDKNRYLEKQKSGTFKTKKKNKLLNTLGFICYFIPGVNVIFSSFSFNSFLKLSKAVVEKPAVLN